MSITVCPHCQKALSSDDAEGIYCEYCGGNITRPPAIDNFTYDGPPFQPNDGKDHRLDCWFCGEPSIAVAPQHIGGDIDRPCHYIPVCAEHAANWYDDVPSDEEIGMIPRDGVFLTREQAEAAYEVLKDHAPTERGMPLNPMHVEAVHALGAGLRGLDAF